MAHLRQTVRNLVKAPVTMGIAALSLALGMGANTAIYSTMNQHRRAAPRAGGHHPR